MSDPQHATAEHAVEEHGLAPRQYVLIGLILTVITAVELWVSYAEDFFGEMLVPVLFILSAVKFVMVVGLFMHLKFDNRIFTWMFAGGFLLAVAVLIALISLFWTDTTDLLGQPAEHISTH